MNAISLTGWTLSQGQYILRELIGVGGMGAVYLGEEPSLNRQVAIKVIQSNPVDPTFVRRFDLEAKTAAALDHPNIIKIYGRGTDQNYNYIVMPYLRGGTLSQRLKQRIAVSGPLPSLADTAQLLNQIASAIDYAHSQKVIHRDIKTSNIMFDNRGWAFLVDFGIAKLAETPSELTGTGMGLGTAYYMPPEQIKGKPVLATDQYALAVVIYFMVTGRMPFEGDTLYDIQHKHIHDMPTPPHSFRTDVPEAVTIVLERALAKDPNKRFETVTAFAQAFERAIAGHEGKVTDFFTFKVKTDPIQVPPTHPPTPRTPSRPGPGNGGSGGRNPLVWVLGAVILVLAVLLGAFLASTLGTGGATPTPIPTEMAGNLSPTATTETPVTPPTDGPGDNPPPATPAPTNTDGIVFVTNTPTPSPTEAPVTLITPSATPSATATDTPTITPTPTLTPTHTATRTPRPTATPQPTSTVMPGGVLTTFRDDFDRNLLSSHWGGWGTRPRAENSQLMFIGDSGNWNGITRSDITENEGVLVLFRPVRGQVWMGLASGDSETSDYREWVFWSENSLDWRLKYAYGAKGQPDYTMYTTRLQLNHWYYLLLRVGEDGEFSTQIWDRDNPSEYIINHTQKPRLGRDWGGRDWTFILQGGNSLALIESYEELRFPAEYAMPETPPITDSAGVVTTATPQAVDCWWTEDFTTAPPASAYSYGPQTGVSSAADNLLLLQSRGGIGRFYNREKVTSGSEWAIAFDFQVAHGDSGTGIFQVADGFMFAFVPVVPTISNNSAGGGALGFMNGSGFRYGVEFDLWQNSEYNDTTAHHIALLERSVGNHIRRRGWSLQLNTWYHAEIRMDNSRIIVLIDDEIMVNGTVSYNPNQEGYFGFSASSGDYNEQIRLDNVQMCSGVTDIADAPPVRFAATIAPTATPTRTPRPTHTPTARPTNTPRPTATALATSAVMPGGVEVTWQDEFNGSSVSSRWQRNYTGTGVSVVNGELTFVGPNRWGNSISRQNISEGEGVLVLFQYEPGQMEFYFDNQQPFGTSTYKRWGIGRYNSTWGMTCYGTIACDNVSPFSLIRGRWYYVMLRVEEGGRFSTQIWQRDNPTRYVLNVRRSPIGQTWDNVNWLFVLQVHSGTVRVDTYQELRFPADYDIPSTPPLTPQQAGTGLLGEYYNNSNLTRLITTRVDPRINFVWGSRAPITGVNAETFSARWTGWIEPLYSEEYTFIIRSDDGARLSIDGRRIINSWIDQSAEVDRTGRIRLNAGQKYEIELEYYENTYDAQITLWWQSASQRKLVVPQSALYPADEPTATATPTPSRTPRPAATRTPTPRANVRTYTVEVSARDFWANTDISIRAGQRVSITYVRGQWGWCQGCRHNAQPAGDRHNWYGVNAPIGTLIGRVGVTGTTFTVGNSYSFTSRTSDNLILMMNDAQSGLNDNYGAITVRVEVETP